MNKVLRLLLVEDSPSDAALIVTALRRGGREVEFQRVDRASAMRTALTSAEIDVITCDWAMPGFSATAALAILKESGLDLPFIIVSGTVGEDMAVEAMRCGAHDYVLKDRLARLSPAIDREIRDAKVRRAEREAGAALSASDNRYRRIIENTNQGVWVIDGQNRTTFLNPRMAEMLGSTVAAVMGRSPAEFLDDDGRSVLADTVARHKQGQSWQSEVRFIRGDGTAIFALVEASPVLGPAGEYQGAFAMVMDVTARRNAEEALHERTRLTALIADVGVAVTHAETLDAMLRQCTDAVVKHLGAAFARIWTLDAGATVLELQASSGLYTHCDGAHARVPVGKFKIGLIAQDREPHLTNNVLGDSRIGDPAWARREGMVSFAGYPLIVGGVLVGVIAMFGREAMTATTLDGLRAIADAIALGIQRKRAEASTEALEAQLRQGQKLEAIGSLAGGIAHDFNNLLSVIISYSEFIASELGPGHPFQVPVEQISAAGMRAAALTRQLLAFSRRQVLQPCVLNLNEIVRNVQGMLRRLITEEIELVVSADPDIGNVNADPGQIEQLLMNLVVNARDAMPSGGMITLETARANLDSAFTAQHAGTSPGSHVRLSVSDTGLGMSPAVQARVFEPFFTTKDPGKGTGLGLSTVFGIAKQSGGAVTLDSEPGVGTTFKVYFPTVEAVISPAVTRGRPSIAPGSETVLLCEDDEYVRVLVRAILTRHGYRVLAAQNGGEALMMCEQHSAAIHLLLTDVVMPMMSGRQLAERLHPIRPDMRVLYMSGYMDDAVMRHGISNFAFLQKPVTPETLSKKVREVLDADPIAIQAVGASFVTRSHRHPR